MSKSNKNRLHAMIDEIAELGDEDLMQALEVLLGIAVQKDASDADLDGIAGDGKRSKKRGEKATEEGDDDTDLAVDDGEDDTDLDLDGDEDKPKKGKKSSKKDEEEEEADEEEEEADEEEEEADELPTLEKLSSKSIEKFFAELAESNLEVETMGLTELKSALRDEFGVGIDELKIKLPKKGNRGQVRKAKTEQLQNYHARMQYAREQLLEHEEAGVAKFAKLMDLDIEEPELKSAKKRAKLWAGLLVGAYIIG